MLNQFLFVPILLFKILSIPQSFIMSSFFKGDIRIEAKRPLCGVTGILKCDITREAISATTSAMMLFMMLYRLVRE